MDQRRRTCLGRKRGPQQSHHVLLIGGSSGEITPFQFQSRIEDEIDIEIGILKSAISRSLKNLFRERFECNIKFNPPDSSHHKKTETDQTSDLPYFRSSSIFGGGGGGFIWQESVSILISNYALLIMLHLPPPDSCWTFPRL